MLIEDIEYVIFRHPDLAAVRELMVDHGLLDLQQGGDTLYLRSDGDAPFSYASTQAEGAFVGFGFRATSREALGTLATRFDSAVTECPHPDGGVYAAGTDPAGFHMEHFVDVDLIDGSSPVLSFPFGRETLLQWGPAFPGL